MKTSDALLGLVMVQLVAGSLLMGFVSPKYEVWVGLLTLTGMIATFIGSRSAANLEYLQEQEFKRLEQEHEARKKGKE
jgi:hypothetical protein